MIAGWRKKKEQSRSGGVIVKELFPTTSLSWLNPQRAQAQDCYSLLFIAGIQRISLNNKRPKYVTSYAPVRSQEDRFFANCMTGLEIGAVKLEKSSVLAGMYHEPTRCSNDLSRI